MPVVEDMIHDFPLQMSNVGAPIIPALFFLCYAIWRYLSIDATQRGRTPPHPGGLAAGRRAVYGVAGAVHGGPTLPRQEPEHLLLAAGAAA